MRRVRQRLTCIVGAVLLLGVTVYMFKDYLCGNNVIVYLQQYTSSTLNCSQQMAILNKEMTNQDDERLIYAIKQCYMEPPSKLPYNLSQPNRQSYAQGGQDEYIDNILYHKNDGFFVESGAADGEAYSNSLHFELHRHWTGLLIEPLSQQFNQLKLKHRKSFIVHACLSIYPYPMEVQLRKLGLRSSIVDVDNKTISASLVENKTITANVDEIFATDDFETIQCLPFYSILLASGRTHVDVFSLDIEGDELLVLQTIPWTKVDIKVWIIEYNNIKGYNGLKDRRQALIDYMTGIGYTALPLLYRRGWQDMVFVQTGLTYDKDYIAKL